MFTPERALQIVEQALGSVQQVQQINELQILSIRPWAMGALVAQDLQPAAGVFLAGDSAHQFPPAGGFGMNTGIQDAHNLAWRLARVYHGSAPASLLRGYSAERRPVAISNAALSVHNLRRSFRVAECLGVDPRAPEALKELLPPASSIGYSAALAAGRQALTLGRQHLSCLEKPGHPHGERLIAAAREVLNTGGGLPLLFPRHDIGFRYAVVDNSSSSSGAQPSSNTAAVAGLTSIALGARMPHYVLELQQQQQQQQRGSLFSTVDIAAQAAACLPRDQQHSAGPLSVLLVLSGDNAQAWTSALQELQTESSAAADVLVLVVSEKKLSASRSATTDSNSATTAGAAAVTETQLLADCMHGAVLAAKELPLVLQALDVTGGCTAAMTEAQFEALLVRPDGHVGWAAAAALSSDAAKQALAAGLQSAVGMLR
eukprot:6231-Heterococcus_DN1.PRE.2